MTFNILLAGVGGLGAISTSVILARAAHLDGYQVGGVQVHGLAQRGGSIPVHLRFGKEEIYSPLLPPGEADLVLALELIEALRYPEFVSKNRTSFIIDTYQIKPANLNLLKQEYPSLEEVKEKVSLLAKKAIFVQAGKLCREKFGNPLLGNVMLLGIALKEGILPLSKHSLSEAIKVTLPREVEKNLEALELGWAGVFP